MSFFNYKCCGEEYWSILDRNPHLVDPGEDGVLPDQGQDILEEVTEWWEPEDAVLNIVRGGGHEGYKAVLEEGTKWLDTEIMKTDNFREFCQDQPSSSSSWAEFSFISKLSSHPTRPTRPTQPGRQE